MGKKAPKPPDPKATSQAQTGTNVATAVANAYLGNADEYTPDGSRTSEFGNTYAFTDPYTGQTYQIPKLITRTTLSPGQQAIKGQQDAADLNLATLGNKLSGTLGNQLTDNFKLGNEATEARLFELGRKRLDPALSQRREGLETRLSNQGIKLGSEAYRRALEGDTQGQNDAYNQLLLQGRGLANQESLTEDNQRINQISALLNGGQVSQPNFIGANTPTIQTTDNAGIINNNYQQRLAAWQQKQASLGGLFSGIGGALALSDRRAKTDIAKIGKTDDGQKIYAYRYKGEGKGQPFRLGLMAQEVERKRPDAVTTLPGGLKAVDYGKALQLGA